MKFIFYLFQETHEYRIFCCKIDVSGLRGNLSDQNWKNCHFLSFDFTLNFIITVFKFYYQESSKLL